MMSLEGLLDEETAQCTIRTKFIWSRSRTKQCEQWLAENSEAINAYNEHVEAHGVFSDSVRSF